MRLAQKIDGGSNLYLYGAAFWTFFHGEVSSHYRDPATTCKTNCITNQAHVANTPRSLHCSGVNKQTAKIMILDDNGNPAQSNNPGGWNPGGVIAAYLKYIA